MTLSASVNNLKSIRIQATLELIFFYGPAVPSSFLSSESIMGHILSVLEGTFGTKLLFKRTHSRKP